jgi:hypothetical protein
MAMSNEFTWADIVRSQRSEKAAAYQKYMTGVRSVIEKNGPEVQRANADLAALNAYRSKDVMPGTVHNNSTMSNMSVQYANEEYIGEQLMPVLQVAKKSDIFYKYGQRDRLAYPDDSLGQRGEVADISESRSTDTYACVTRGLSNGVDAETLENQDAPLNELLDINESVSEARAFKVEQRISTVMTTVGSYASGNTSAIAAGSRWDTAGGGNPAKNIMDALAAIWTGRGPSDLVMWSSLDVYNVLARHPQILELFKYTKNGFATPDMIAGFFGVSKYLVGKARSDTANVGAAASYSRLWGTDNFGITRVARRASIRNAVFGYSFQHGSVESTQWFDQRPGKRGFYYAKQAWSHDYKVVANDTAYYFRTVIG